MELPLLRPRTSKRVVLYTPQRRSLPTAEAARGYKEMNMRLRWFVICDDNGVKSEPELQYMDDYGDWVGIEYVVCKSWEADDYMSERG